MGKSKKQKKVKKKTIAVYVYIKVAQGGRKYMLGGQKK
jgi:hypothetical protein